ncbi:solute carrier family 66 member 3-like [Antedon mediterranea]|uniref:solute carrier family 66 member 3-like n=1 Tax=Antedon mediterranea TaxID=105859 RepID=UPI003AF875E5
MEGTIESGENDGIHNSYWPYILTLLNLYCIIPCTFNKLPTVWTIFKSGNIEGVSLRAVLLETYCFSAILVYNFVNGYSLQLYAEYLLILIQEMLLISVMLSYCDMLTVESLVKAIIFFTCVYLSASGFVPINILSIAMATCPLIILYSRILFIKEMVKVKDSSSMSQVTWILSVTTGLSRLISIAVETGDSIAIGHNLISVSASALVLITIYYYKPRKSKSL